MISTIEAHHTLVSKLIVDNHKLESEIRKRDDIIQLLLSRLNTKIKKEDLYGNQR